jgi:predicted PurR-regulated permease PerM
MQKFSIDVSWATLWRLLFFLILVAVAYLGRYILLGLFLAIVISSGFEALITFLERRGLPRTLGVILVFLFAVLIVIVLLSVFVPLLVTDFSRVFSDFETLAKVLGVGGFFSPETVESIGAFVDRIASRLFAPSASPLAIISEVLGGAGLLVAIFVTAFYLSLSRDGVERFILAVFPRDSEEVALKIYERSIKKIGRWFRAQILLSVVVGLLVWIALALLGVKYAFLLAVLAAVFELVPFVGPILSGSAAALSALTISPALAFWTVLVFLGIHQLENHVLVPLFMRRAVGLHPVIVIIALLIGVQAGGILGMVVAVPAAAVLQEVVENWSSRKRPEPQAA